MQVVFKTCLERWSDNAAFTDTKLLLRILESKTEATIRPDQKKKKKMCPALILGALLKLPLRLFWSCSVELEHSLVPFLPIVSWDRLQNLPSYSL